MIDRLIEGKAFTILSLFLLQFSINPQINKEKIVFKKEKVDRERRSA